MKINIEQIRRNIGETFSRFAMTIAYCAALALFCTLMNRDMDFGKDYLNTAMTIYLVTGIFVSFSIDLRRQIYGKRWMWVAAIISHVTIILNAIYVAYVGQTDFWTDWQDRHHMALKTAHWFDIAAVVMLCVVSPIVRPFFRWKDDMRMWHFSRKFIINGALNGIVVVALQVGTLLLLACAEKLFNITINNLYADVLIWLWLFLFPTIILMRTPLLAEIQTERVTDKFSFVILRLFSILLCIYLLMLYVYILRIAVIWELPKGMVSMPVSCMMILLIVVRCIAYGINTEGKKFDGKFLKLLPWLALPTLVLMSVGIGRRLMDYGMTAPRFYLIILNLWFYAMCVYMILRQRLMPIVVSFIVIAFFSSFGPTSAWRLFPQEDVEKTENEVEETPKYQQYISNGRNYLCEGIEISLPEPTTKLTSFYRNLSVCDMDSITKISGKEFSLIDGSDEYLIDVIKDYPFQISRSQLLGDYKQKSLTLKCTNGKTIVLIYWECHYDDEDVSTDIKLNEIVGYLVE